MDELIKIILELIFYVRQTEKIRTNICRMENPRELLVYEKIHLKELAS